jgi:hypothetical protein
MICQFCQQDYPQLHYFLDEQVVCEGCDEWILCRDRGSHNGGFGRVTENGRIARLWHTFGSIPSFDSVSIYFQYDKGNTVIVEHYDEELGGMRNYRILLTFDTVLPITRQLLADVPHKLKLWVVFS